MKTLYARPDDNDGDNDNDDDDNDDDSDDNDGIDYLAATSTTVIGMQTHCDASEVHSCLLSTGANNSIVVLAAAAAVVVVVVVISLSMLLIVMPSSLSTVVELGLSIVSLIVALPHGLRRR